jgi:2-polyprenyl-3-methyl-5-hydroxy-6-metoxy-1,4-benzoquinol methylase
MRRECYFVPFSYTVGPEFLRGQGHRSPARYDAVVSVTALHHLPLGDALRRLSAALRPGGVLAAIALPQPDLPRELPVELLAAAGHRALGATFIALRTAGRGDW